MSYFTITVGPDVRPGERFAIPKLQGEGVSLYNITGGTLPKGGVYFWEVVGYTPGTADQAVACATSDTIRRMIVVAMEEVLTGKIGKFQYSGFTPVKCQETGSLSLGRYMEVTGSNAYLEDGASLDVYSVGVLAEAIVAGENSGSPVIKTVYLRGERIITT